MKNPRPEQEIFDELAALTATPGFAHVIATFCVRDNWIWYREDVRAEDMDHLYSSARLIRTEMFTLIGLMVRAAPDFDAPPPDDAFALAKRAEALLSELHDSMMRPWSDPIRKMMAGDEWPNRWTFGDAMREPIFYGGEGAFSFQNCDFAAKKYAADNDWLIANKGAAITDMIAVAKAIGILQTEKLTAAIRCNGRGIGNPRFLEAFTFTPIELEPHLNVPCTTIIASVKAFSLPTGHHNTGFKALNDFNAVNATPILAVDEERFILFHWNALAEALYESPFYWFLDDKAYSETALKHRGAFTEAFAFQRLGQVFGAARVYRGVNIEGDTRNRRGEIDVLVLFGDRAIVLQAKSKRLTLEARRGNDLQIKADFKAAVQDAYDQAMDCAVALKDPSLRFVTSDGTELAIPAELSQIFPICVVSDHYPALAFQARRFLVHRQVPTVLAPLIIDIFTLDTMAEMLNRPLRFLSYLELRAIYGSKVHINHETTLLSYHLKYNLWLNNDCDMVDLGDDFTADLEIAMNARRLGFPGKTTPDGILTAVAGRKIDEIIAAIEAEPFGPIIDFVLLVYQLSGTAMGELADGVDRVLDRARQKGSSDFSMGFAGSGLTIHANFSRLSEAKSQLEGHVAYRKYREKAESWYGLSLSGVDGAIRFGIKIAFPWAFDAAVSRAAKRLGTGTTRQPALSTNLKLGRNDPCYCGSGKKYKKCHLAADARR